MINCSNDSRTFDIATLSCEFRHPVTEEHFHTHYRTDIQSQLRRALLFCSAFYLAFTLTDLAALGYGRAACLLLLARIGVAASAALGCMLSYRLPHSTATAYLVANTVEIIGMAAFMLIVASRPAELPWHGISMVIMLIVIYIYIPNRIAYSLAVALVSTAVFIAVSARVAQLSQSDLITMSMLLLLANLFGMLAARRYHRLWREQFRALSFLKNLSMRDHLTGCLNRRYLQEQLFNSEIAHAQRYQQNLTVIMCDLDHFKFVNDTYGHFGGDAVLREFSRLLQGMTREHIDSVVRYGGEEFLMILPSTDLHGGMTLAERLRTAFAAQAIEHGSTHRISATASFGVSSVDFSKCKSTLTLETLIASADRLLYDAKTAGRNQIRWRQFA